MFGLNWTTSGGDPRAHRQEIGGAWGGYSKTKDGQASGLIAGTLVVTELGWRPVEAVVAGDMVLTFDGGLQRVRSVIRGQLWQSDERCPEPLWPLYVPAEALGNSDDMVLPPEQIVVLESDAADRLLQDPFAPIRVDALEGYRGIERVCPQMEVEVVLLQFDQDEIVFAAGGALMLCPCVGMVDIALLMSAEEGGARYRALNAQEAARLVDCLRVEDRQFAALDRTNEQELTHAA